MDTVTIPALQQMKRDGKKSVGVVAWDFPIARIADRAGVDFISVGDSVGVNLWGHANPLEVTLDEMLVVCKAVRRGTQRALVSCDLPFGPVQQGVETALAAAYNLRPGPQERAWDYWAKRVLDAEAIVAAAKAALAKPASARVGKPAAKAKKATAKAKRRKK